MDITAPTATTAYFGSGASARSIVKNNIAGMTLSNISDTVITLPFGSEI